MSNRLYWELIQPWIDRQLLLKVAKSEFGATGYDGPNKAHPYLIFRRDDGNDLTISELRRVMHVVTRPPADVFTPTNGVTVWAGETVEYTLRPTDRTLRKVTNVPDFHISVEYQGTAIAAVKFESRLYEFALMTNHARNFVLTVNVAETERLLGALNEVSVLKLLYAVAKQTGCVFTLRQDNKLWRKRQPNSWDWHNAAPLERDQAWDRDDADREEAERLNISVGDLLYERYDLAILDDHSADWADDEYEDEQRDPTAGKMIVRINKLTQADNVLIHYYLQAADLDSPRAQFLHYYNCLEYFIDKDRRRLVKIAWDAFATQGKDDPWSANFNDYLEAVDRFGGEERSLVNQITTVIPDIRATMEAFIRSEVGEGYLQSPDPLLQSIGLTAVQLGDPELVENLIRRIYKVRNSLVHAKHGSKKLIPFESDHAVSTEVPLVKRVAEMLMDI